MQTPELSIIIVNWNSRDYVRECIRSIFLQLRGLTFEIIVVDGASNDGCEEMLAQEYSGVRFVQCGSNVGFARANNRGFKETRGKLLLFLNPDTELVGSCVDSLRAAVLGLQDAGIAGARLVNTNGSVQTSCIQTFPTILNQIFDTDFLRRQFPQLSCWGTAPLFAAGENPVSVEVLSGACLMMRREVFERVGGFNESYFLYAEDLDLCHKVRAAGLKNYYVPAAIVRHHGGGSSSGVQSVFSNVMMRESVYRFLKRARGGWYGLGFRCSMAVSALGRLLLLLCLMASRFWRGNSSAAKSALRKWTAILRWSVGLEPWVRNFH